MDPTELDEGVADTGGDTCLLLMPFLLTPLGVVTAVGERGAVAETGEGPLPFAEIAREDVEEEAVALARTGCFTLLACA